MAQVPQDFNWKVYLALNHDLRPNGVANEALAKRHWRMHGSREQRRYSTEHFSWEEYRDANPDLAAKESWTEKDFLDHWINQGIDEQRLPYFPIKSESQVPLQPQVPPSQASNTNQSKTVEDGKKLLILLSHGLGGGLSKYVKDLMTKFSTLCHRHQDYQIITNEKDTIGKYQNGASIVRLLESDQIPDQTILHLNIMTENYQIQKVDQIFNLLTRFKEKEGRKLLITVHDYFWLWPSTPNLTNDKFNSQRPNSIQSVNQIFQLADLIIFPTHAVKHRYCEKGLDLSSVNYVVEKHNDYYYTDITPYYQRIDDKIRILFVGNFCLHKGSEHIKNMANRFPPDDQERIEFHILGEKHVTSAFKFKVFEHGKYTNDNVFTKINQIKPHLFIMSSIFYETYSYVASIILKTGLPIFYNREVYQERLQYREGTNVYSYNSVDPIEKIAEDLRLACQDLRRKANEVGKDYIPSEEKPDLYVTGFYENLYGRIEEKGINRIEEKGINRIEEKGINRIKEKGLIKRIDHQTRLETLYLESKDQYAEIHQKIRPFAIYFPQFHRVEENNYNFYPGYTDMINLRQLKKNSDRTETEHILTPLDDWLGYYDLLLDDEILDRQILTAKAHGIYGFAIYMYWFTKNGYYPGKHKVMHRVLEKIFSKQYNDFHFYLIWPNENWNSNLTNDYGNLELMKELIMDMIPYFKHPNYYCSEGKPIFGVLHHSLIPGRQLDQIVALWKKEVKDNGFDGLHLSYILGFGSPIQSTADSYYINAPAWKQATMLGTIKRDASRTIVDYRSYLQPWEKDIIKPVQPGKDVILNIFPDFDNSARKYTAQNFGTISNYRYINATHANFQAYLNKILNMYSELPNQTKIVLINAWNEWGENMSIEPSNEHQFQLLESIRQSLINYYC